MCQKEEEKSALAQDAKKQTTGVSQTLDETNSYTLDRSILIYDGDCGFCTTSAKKAKSLVSSLEITPWQSTELSEFGLTEQQVSERAYLIEPGSPSHKGGADAIFGTLAIADSKLLSLVGNIWLYPPLSWLGRALYPVLARNRHRLPGATDACRLD